MSTGSTGHEVQLDYAVNEGKAVDFRLQNSLTCQSCRYGHVVTEEMTVISEKNPPFSASGIDGQLNCGIVLYGLDLAAWGVTGAERLIPVPCFLADLPRQCMTKTLLIIPEVFSNLHVSKTYDYNCLNSLKSSREEIN